MSRVKLSIYIYVLLQIALTFKANAQYSILVCGGNSSGNGGNIENSIGLLFYKTQKGSNGSVSQGLQQPIEISVISSLQKIEDNVFDISVFPNPTNDFISISFKDFVHKETKFCIYDICGKILQEGKIENAEAKIRISTCINSIFILKIFDDSNEIKTFKIIKYK